MPDTHVIVKLMKRRTFACKARDNEVHYTMAVSALRGKKKKRYLVHISPDEDKTTLKSMARKQRCGRQGETRAM